MGGKVISNLDQLAEGIGSYLGLMEGLKQKDYMDDLLTETHKTVAREFNRAAMNFAMGGGAIKHMYEYGTAGINDLGPTHYASGMNPNARLWRNELVGGGGRKTIGFTFLPAKKQTPPHDFEELGIDPSKAPPLKVDTGQRKYYFPAKATVVESGSDVKVFAKWSKRLFIPTKTEGLPSEYTGDPSRGYVWAKSHVFSPGEATGGTGKFTTFYSTWWSKEGAEQMGTMMMKKVETDLTTVAQKVKPSKHPKSVASTNIKALVEKGRKKTRKQFELYTDFDNGEGEQIL
jgi:hypothetical protein